MAGLSTHAHSADRSDFRRPEEIPFPADNLYTSEKAALGKALFFDVRMSGAENMNCASCHNPSFGWEVPVKTAVGSLNTRLARRAPTILDAAWIGPFFWDGRAATAEQQAKGPIENPAEMNLPLPAAVARLSAIDGYKKWFARVFPNEGITPDTIVRSIATFERTIVASHSPFDSWVEGDETALTDAQKRGFALFVGKAHCVYCHSGWNFTDNKFHDTGLAGSDPGRSAVEVGNRFAKHAFKTPTLRDIGQRAPYMHNGEMATLADVVAHYLVGGVDRPSRDPVIGPLDLSDGEFSDLVAFLNSLTGARQIVPMPVLPN
jgi:cytochrome c peroxidase